MIDVITKIFCALLCGFSIAFTYCKISNLKVKINKFFICSILLSLIIYVSYTAKYSSGSNVLKIILFIVVFKIIYKETTYRTVITTLFSIILMLIGEIITSFILINNITVSQARTNGIFFLISNIIVCLIMIIISMIKFVNIRINRFIIKTDANNKFSTIVLFFSSIIVITYLFYNISINYGWNEKYIITIIIIISYIIITFIFFKDKFEYTMLEEKYDMLFEYFSEISENIDELNLTTHEYKNQIAIVGNYIDNKKYKKAKEYINDIASSINKDEGLLVNLSDIPNGGLKGLLYYKIIVAKNQKVEIVLDVGKNVKRNLKKLSEDEIKIITRIIGVYIDNAVSASKNKIINIEIYNLDDELYFTISNKIDKNVNIDNIGKKGFTTKGKGHGKGIYLTNRLIARNKWLRSENKIVNNYYVSKLIIDTKNIGN